MYFIAFHQVLQNKFIINKIKIIMIRYTKLLWEHF